MGYVIAIAGKGGVGKTTIASLLVRYLKEKGENSVLAVDADPNSNLADSLSVAIDNDLGSMIDDIAKNPSQIPAGVSRDKYIEYKIETLMSESDSFDVLTMGRPEGPGCYCAVNNTLRALLGKLMKSYKYVIMDNEAGMEHLSRRTTRSADLFLLVSDATVPGIKAAKRIANLTSELNIDIKNRYVIVNRLNKEMQLKNIEKEFSGLNIKNIFTIPADEKLQKISIDGASIFQLDESSEVVSAFKKMMEEICP